jgi:hypothetical protein
MTVVWSNKRVEGKTPFGTRRLPLGTLPLFRDQADGTLYALDTISDSHPVLSSVVLSPALARTASIRDYVRIGGSGYWLYVQSGRLLFGPGDATVGGSRVIMADRTKGRYELDVEDTEVEI